MGEKPEGHAANLKGEDVDWQHGTVSFTRKKTVGYPERFAQEALGHNSKAVHRA